MANNLQVYAVFAKLIPQKPEYAAFALGWLVNPASMISYYLLCTLPR